MADAPAPAAATPANTPVPVVSKAPAPPAPAVKPGGAPPTPDAPFIELVVDGRPKKFTEAEARRLLSKSSFADKTVLQAKTALKAAQQLQAERESEKDRLKKDTEAYLRERGIDPDAFAHSILERRLGEAQMSPDQRRIAELEAQHRALADKLTAADTKEAETKAQAQQRVLQQKLETDLASAADAAGIPKDGNGFYAVYAVTKEFFDAGLPHDPVRICEIARENLNSAQSGLKAAVLKDMDGGALEEMLGAPNVEKLIRYRMERLRGGGVKRPALVPSAAPPSTESKSEYQTRDQLRERMLKMGGQ